MNKDIDKNSSISELIIDYKNKYEEYYNIIITNKKVNVSSSIFQNQVKDLNNIFILYYTAIWLNLDVSEPQKYDFPELVAKDFNKWFKDNKENLKNITKDNIEKILLEIDEYKNISKETIRKYKVNQRLNEINKFLEDNISRRERIDTPIDLQKMEKEIENNYKQDYLKNNKLNTKSISNDSSHSIARCPHCGSINFKKISTAKRIVSTGALGLASSTIGNTFSCGKCGYKW